jgi:hypothetical protein
MALKRFPLPVNGLVLKRGLAVEFGSKGQRAEATEISARFAVLGCALL